MNQRSELIISLRISGELVDVIGYCDNDTKPGEYDWFDLFVGSECINEGNPLFTLSKVKQSAEEFLKDFFRTRIKWSDPSI